MPDWQEFVRRELSGLVVDAAEKDEIHAELASHLQETYEASLREGMIEPQALSRAISVAGSWQDLRREIQMARREGNYMTNRVRQLWLPGLLTLFTSMSLLMLIQFFGPNPWVIDRHTSWLHVAPVGVIYIPWLLTLPVIGAIGALLSIQAGASRRMVLASILFPVLPYLCFCLIGFPMALILEERFTHFILASSILVGFLAWVLLPSAALLAGGLPTQLFLWRQRSRQVVIK